MALAGRQGWEGGSCLRNITAFFLPLWKKVSICEAVKRVDAVQKGSEATRLGATTRTFRVVLVTTRRKKKHFFK
jgi:hypothetical protein